MEEVEPTDLISDPFFAILGSESIVPDTHTHKDTEPAYVHTYTSANTQLMEEAQCINTRNARLLQHRTQELNK